VNRGLVDAHLRHAADAIGTPCYVYFLEMIEERIAELRRAFQDRFSLSFAVKSNPNPALLGWLASRVDQIDVSSIGELRLARFAGWHPDRASFTGPAKRKAEIREAIGAGVGELVVESVREAVIADRIAGEEGCIQDVVVRIAPDHVPRGFGDQMAGKPAAFGIDIESIDAELPLILALPNLHVTGLHIYSGTQCLKPEAICQNYRTFIATFRTISEAHGLCPTKLIFGSGLGIPYHDEDAPLDLLAVAEGIAPDLAAMKDHPCFADARLVLELGRYLIGEAGYFVTEVIGTKESRGTRIGICDGGMNNHLPASGHFGMVMRRNYSMHRVGGGDGSEKIDLVGPLCTSIDRLAIGAMLPRLEEGDLVAIHNSGAYGLTASPLHFISHAPPHEVTVDSGIIRDVSRPLSDIF
jgi:diaminopimelate decarboxylase